VDDRSTQDVSVSHVVLLAAIRYLDDTAFALRERGANVPVLADHRP
jgi:hypothetical protein